MSSSTDKIFQQDLEAARAKQPRPIPNSNAPITEQVIEDMRARMVSGTKQYGTPLQAFNGRDALWDAYEEALDLCMYLKQALVERGRK